jgi:NAD(P)-dependent dehydrogenase (short-subunit alcohol dehydrogenase family)
MLSIAMDKLKKHTLVIGGSSGIGRETSMRLSCYDNVSVLARRADELSSIYGSTDILSVTADVCSFDDLTNAINECVSRFGKINRLIYSAGVQIIKPHRIMTPSDFDTLLNINLRGALYASKLFCSAKVSEKDAVFCAVSSIASNRPEAGILGYSATKAALDNLIRGLAKECAPRRFVGVSPGWLDTEMTQNQSIYNDNFREELEKISPLGITEVVNVVDAIEFLVGDAASSITGQILCIDSGSSL